MAQRSLRFTDTYRVIDASNLDGKFRIREKRSFGKNGNLLREWLADDNNFVFLGHSGHLCQCQLCSEVDEHVFKTMLEAKSNKLKAMDLFAGKDDTPLPSFIVSINLRFVGAGGLTTGIDGSGFVETCWAVEMAHSASLTLKSVLYVEAENNPY